MHQGVPAKRPVSGPRRSTRCSTSWRDSRSDSGSRPRVSRVSSTGGARRSARAGRWREPAHLPPGEGLEWTRSRCRFEEVAADPSGPRRRGPRGGGAAALLYVGLTRARVHLAISWAAERETRGRTSRRLPSRLLAERARPAQRVMQMPDRFEEEQQRRRSVRSVASAGADPADDDPLMAALRAWRTARAREDAVPAYVVFHDQTLAAIAEVRPATLAGLRELRASARPSSTPTATRSSRSSGHARALGSGARRSALDMHDARRAASLGGSCMSDAYATRPGRGPLT